MGKIILICISFFFTAIANAEPRPVAEILEYGIFTGGYEYSVVDTNAPTGKLLLGGVLKLEKQTTVIPAKLTCQFGFRFVVHGRPDDEPVRLRIVYLFPEMKDPKTGSRSKRCDFNILVKPEDTSPQMLWNFTDDSELVTGKWRFQVFRGEEMILEKVFDVVQ
jgi:hypothetical protein